MLKSISKSMWILGCLSLFAFAGLSGGLRMIHVEDEDFRHEGRNLMGDSGLYLELEPSLMIARAGYNSQTYIVKTADGYLLTVHRIFSKGAGENHPVMVQHGLVSSAADWLISGPGKSLPYLLADEGYDVWIPNIRGNTYSRAHMDFSTTSPQFWNYTFHEMGFYDVPAITAFILKETGHAQLSYVGHSMGTSMFFAFCATHPELQSRIRQMHALAPIAFMSRLKSPIRKVAPFVKVLQVALPTMNQYECFEHGQPLGYIEMELVRLTNIGAKSFDAIMGALVGPDPEQSNKTLQPMILGHYPAGSSCRSLLHYLQEINTGKFQQYDEGSVLANMRRYGTAEPPEYDLSKVKVPIYLHYGQNDYLAAVEDVELLYEKLKHGSVKMMKVAWKAFNHIDFLYAIDAKKYVYDAVIDALNAASQMVQSTGNELPSMADRNMNWRKNKMFNADHFESASDDIFHRQKQHHPEQLNAKMLDSPEEAFGDAHLELFRMSMLKIHHLPNHLVNKMLSTMTEKASESAAAGNEDSRE